MDRPRIGSRAVSRDGGSYRAWSVGALALAMLAALLLASCGQGPASGSGEETAPSGEEAESAGQAIGVSVADVTDNPDEFYGKTVTLSGLVSEVVAPTRSL